MKKKFLAYQSRVKRKPLIKKDTFLSRVFDSSLNGWPAYITETDLQPFFDRRNKITLEQGVILWGMPVVVPEKFRARLLLELHEEH